MANGKLHTNTVYLMLSNGEQKSVSQLNSEDLNHLKPEDNEEKLVNYVYNIMDMMTKLTGAKREATAKLELDGYSKWYQEEQTRIQNVVTDFNTNYEKYLNEFIEKMHFTTEAQKTMLDLMGQGNTNIDNASSEILQAGHNIATTLGQVNQLLQDSLDEINNKKNEDKTKDSPGKTIWEKLGNWVEKADEGSTHDIGLKVTSCSTILFQNTLRSNAELRYSFVGISK